MHLQPRPEGSDGTFGLCWMQVKKPSPGCSLSLLPCSRPENRDYLIHLANVPSTSPRLRLGTPAPPLIDYSADLILSGLKPTDLLSSDSRTFNPRNHSLGLLR